MLFWVKILGVLILVLMTMCEETAGTSVKKEYIWSRPFFQMLLTRKEVFQNAHYFQTGFYKHLHALVTVLNDLPEIAFNAFHVSFSTPEEKNFYFNLISNFEATTFSNLYQIIASTQLTNVGDTRGEQIRVRIKRKLATYLESGNHDEPYALPLDEICADIPNNDLPKEITITDVCTNVDSCATVEWPYGEDVGLGDKFTKACTSDKKCDLDKAIPMMAGIFWFELTELIAEMVCPKRCKDGTCKVQETYENVMHDARLLMAYCNILPSYWTSSWDTFFNDAVDNRAYLNADVALSMVLEKEVIFDTTPTACNELEFTNACPYADIYKEYVLLRKNQQYRNDPGLVKDLRLLRNVDHQKMLELQQETARHIELLGAINSLDDNLEASVQGISTYFLGLAKYDEGIAEADVGFIKGELDKYEKALADVEKKIKEDITEAMKKMTVMIAANLATEIAFLGILVAENSNPLKLIFNGPALKDVAEQAGKVADASSQLIKASALYRSLTGLHMDSLEFSKAFSGNKGQITSMKAVVDKIRSGQEDDIGADADKFIVEYGAYTPQTNRSALERNNALWGAFKDATCDLLSGEASLGGSVPQAIAGGKLLCEKLDGTLAQFFTLREDIFDFQFQLVDSVALVVRGNIAKRLSQNIQGKGDVLHARQLMIGFFMMQNKLQSAASVFCDIIEYKQHGKPVDDCSPAKGIFRKANLDALIAFQDRTPLEEVQREVYIPTRAQFEGDTGFVDLQALARGEKVIFKLPADKKWLMQHRWLLAGQTSAPFLTSFELYLPLKEYKTGSERQHTTTQVTIMSIASSAVSIISPNTETVYVLPRKHSTYRTVYEEGYTSCSADEIDNPYSLCDNLPKICDTSTRRPEQSLLPTILSTWSMSVQVHQGSEEVKWNALSSATNLLLRAKVKLQFPSDKKKRRHISSRSTKSDIVVSEDGCCEGNRYRISTYNNKCQTCPKDTTSRLRGLYCEINPEPAEEESSDRKKKKKALKRGTKKRGQKKGK